MMIRDRLPFMRLTQSRPLNLADAARIAPH